MKIKGINESDLRAAVHDASEALYNGNITFRREPEKEGNFLFFTLAVKWCGGRGAHHTAQRRTAAACWHAHRDVMRAIFKRAPAALLVTALARYEGSEGFEHEFPYTGNLQIGSMMNPRTRRESCECSSGEY